MYTKKSLIIITVSLLIFCTSYKIYSSTLFVDTNGDDTWTGISSVCTAPDGPKRNIQTAINAAASGDKLIIAQGTYTYSASINIPAGKNIILQSTDPENWTTVAATIIDAGSNP